VRFNKWNVEFTGHSFNRVFTQSVFPLQEIHRGGKGTENTSSEYSVIHAYAC
jgi:hypothetical protein